MTKSRPNRLSKQDRQKSILSKLNSDVSVRISTLADLFNVSTETIRRDIDALTEKGIINRTYGGAASIPLTSEPGITQRQQTNIAGREKIARIAASLVEPGEVLMIDSGSTTAHFARALTARPMKLTILTNCFPVAQILGSVSDFKVMICPGLYSFTENGIFGQETTAFLNQFHANKTFFSAGGITATGITDADAEACWIKRKMLERSEQSFLLVDNSKFDRPLFNSVCDWVEISDLVADDIPPEDILNSLHAAQVSMHLGEVSEH